MASSSTCGDQCRRKHAQRGRFAPARRWRGVFESPLQLFGFSPCTGAIVMALWPGDSTGLHLSNDDCALVQALAVRTGLQSKSVADLLAAAAAAGNSRGQLTEAQFHATIRQLVPPETLNVDASVREQFSAVLTRLFHLYDWAGDEKVQAQVRAASRHSMTPATRQTGPTPSRLPCGNASVLAAALHAVNLPYHAPRQHAIAAACAGHCDWPQRPGRRAQERET